MATRVSYGTMNTRREQKAETAKMRAAISALRRARKEVAQEARARCREQVGAVMASSRARFERARDEARAIRDRERGAVRTDCATGRAAAKVSKAKELAAAVALLASEQHHQRSLRVLERQASQKERPTTTKRERGAESDDAMRKGIPPELHAEFERVKKRIKAGPRRTRLEAWEEYLHEHGAETSPEAVDDRALVRELEQLQAEEHARSRPKGGTGRAARRARRSTMRGRRGRKPATADDDDVPFHPEDFAEEPAPPRAVPTHAPAYDTPDEREARLAAVEELRLADEAKARKREAREDAKEERAAKPKKPPKPRRAKKARDFDDVRRQLHRAGQAYNNRARRNNETYAAAQERYEKMRVRYEELVKEFQTLDPFFKPGGGGFEEPKPKPPKPHPAGDRRMNFYRVHRHDEPAESVLNRDRFDRWVASDEDSSTQPEGISAAMSLDDLAAYVREYSMNVRPDDQLLELHGNLAGRDRDRYAVRVFVDSYKKLPISKLTKLLARKR